MTDKENRFEHFDFIQPDPFDWKLERAVHIWKFPVLGGFFSLLTDSEKMIGERFRFDGDRNRYITGRRSLRILLSNYLLLDPMDIRIIAEKGQKPFIENAGAPMRFNISHSGEWVVVALSRDELGIDIEKIDSAFDFSDLLQEHFSPAEQQFVATAKIPVAAFYFLWTRKEAVTKAVGFGLRDNLKTVSVLDQFSPHEEHLKKWMIKSFSFSPDYPVSVAYCSSQPEIGYFDGSHLLSGI